MKKSVVLYRSLPEADAFVSTSHAVPSPSVVETLYAATGKFGDV
jgi:hypothetical protein